MFTKTTQKIEVSKLLTKNPPKNQRDTPRGGRRNDYLLLVVVVVFLLSLFCFFFRGLWNTLCNPDRILLPATLNPGSGVVRGSISNCQAVSQPSQGSSGRLEKGAKTPEALWLELFMLTAKPSDDEASLPRRLLRQRGFQFRAPGVTRCIPGFQKGFIRVS